MNTQAWNVGGTTRKNVLLLEDDPELAASLAELLELYSCKVTRVANGIDGLRQIIFVDYDLVLCDLVMPHFPGDKFYRAVERVRPRLCKRFLFMTGHGSDPKWDAFIREIGGAILWKPFQFSELWTAIRTVLKKARSAAEAAHDQTPSLLPATGPGSTPKPALTVMSPAWA